MASDAVLAGLPPVWPEDPREGIRAAVRASRRTLVVLDDDPTGTQTVYDIPVITGWSVEALRGELSGEGPGFYILTNSRSMPAEEAAALNREIARNLRDAAAGPFSVVSRSDSTLRGHFPAETDALREILGPFDATFVIPFFEDGGRYTIDDVHYVAEGDRLVPAAETPFARDAVFGYRSSDLRQWVEEKTGGAVPAGEVRSIAVEELRRGGPEAARKRALDLPRGGVCVVNAAASRDLEVFAAGILEAEARGRRFLFRTAASFVAARLGLPRRPLLGPEELARPGDGGGLTVVGSHVPRTTEQLGRLLARPDLSPVELEAASLVDPGRSGVAVEEAVRRVNLLMREGRDVVLFTSRRVLAGTDSGGNLEIGRRVSEALVGVVRRLDVPPRYLVAKGGITSSDVATRALGVRRAMVMGQVLPGVPVWRLGPETPYPGMPYVVFPGNVGGPEALERVVTLLRGGS